MLQAFAATGNGAGLCLRCHGDRIDLAPVTLTLDLAVARPVRARQDRLSSLRAFRHPNFVRFWLGAFISNVGTWMETIGVGVYVTEATGRAAGRARWLRSCTCPRWSSDRWRAPSPTGSIGGGSSPS
jgi:hypothetical protein